jgi:Na+/melibiose symporter-like transporter
MAGSFYAGQRCFSCVPCWGRRHLLAHSDSLPPTGGILPTPQRERHESLIFGAWTTVHTFGVGTAGLLLGAFLQIFKYNGALDVQNASAQFAVRMGLGLLPGIFLVIAALSLFKYTITRKVYEDIRRELEQGLPGPSQSGKPA